MKIVLQDGIKDCGICCLLSIIRFYGGDVSKEYLREITNTNKSGVTAYDLIEGSKKLGFISEGVSGDLTKIENNNLPCIAHVVVNKSYKHFVVIYDINLKSKRVIIMDPAKGKRVLSLAEFKLFSTGKYIFLKPIKQLPIVFKKKIISKEIKKFIVYNRKKLLFIFILTFVYFVFHIILAFHFKYLLDYSINYNLTNPIYFLSICLLIIYIFRELAIVFRNFLLNKCLSILDYNLTIRIYRQLLLLPYLYYRNRTTGEIISRFKDLNIIKTFLVHCFPTIVDLFGVIVFGMIMFKINSKLALGVIIIGIVMIVIQFIFNGIKEKKIKIISNNSDRTNSYLIESVSNMDTIKGSHLEKRFIDIFSLKYQKLLENIYDYQSLNELFIFIKNICHDILIIIILGLGSYLVIKKRLSIALLVVFQSVFSYFLVCLDNLLDLFNEYGKFKIALGRIEDMFMITCENFVGSSYYLFYDLKGKIVFNNLSYQVSNKKLFSDLSISINDGDKILMIGSSGSGKSTLVKMLMRYFEVPYGKISIGDIDINHYHLEVLRNNITYVGNLDSLFTDTVYNNITLNKEVSDELFKKVADITMVSEIVLDDILGYQKMIEENGYNLSNGERQRIILARALLRKSNIYIFDEAFSQIDYYRTRKILKNIFNYLSDKTIIVISHRYQKKLFERVLKLENGKIYEIEKI